MKTIDLCGACAAKVQEGYKLTQLPRPANNKIFCGLCMRKRYGPPTRLRKRSDWNERLVLGDSACNHGGRDASGMGQSRNEVILVTEQEAIRAFGENCKWLRKRIRDLEEQLGIRQEEQRKMDQEDEEVFRLVHGPREPVSEGCVHIALR